MMMTAGDELQETVSALLDKFAAVPDVPIAAADYFCDEQGGFLSAELIDGSSIYIMLSCGSPISIFRTATPRPKPRHLFSVRNATT